MHFQWEYAASRVTRKISSSFSTPKAKNVITPNFAPKNKNGNQCIFSGNMLHLGLPERFLAVLVV